MAQTATYTPADFLSGVPIPKGYDVADMVRDGWDQPQIEAWMRAWARPWVPDAPPMALAEVQAKFRAELAKHEGERPADASAEHPDVTAMMQRIEKITRSGSLTQGERGILAEAMEALATMGRECGRELADLAGKPLPDPGRRPEARAVFYYRLTYGRGFPLVLGYFHRVREYVERLEAKYGGAGGAAR